MFVRYKRMIAIAVLVLSSGTIFQGGAACTRFAASQVLNAADLCFIFDCQNGILGGAIDPCANNSFSQPIFIDCFGRPPGT